MSFNSCGASTAASTRAYKRFLLLVAGLGGLLYGIDGGIIAGALPYLEATSGLNAGQLSLIVAAVLLGSVISTLFAGLLSDWMGRKKLMALSGVLFVLSIPLIALANGFVPLVLGRLMQGVSAGLIGVVVPLYLAECLAAADRGKGTGIFQCLLTVGIMAAALIGMYFSLRVADVEKLNDAAQLFAFKDRAWRSIFWVSMPPGIFFIIGSLLVAESPRWLFRRGKKEAARAALLRSGTPEEAARELGRMEETLLAEQAKVSGKAEKAKDSLLQRRYVAPFVLACVILACNQLTGTGSIINYNATILIQAGLSDAQAHMGYVLLTVVIFVMTLVAIALVDRLGRKFLLSVGSAGIIVSLACVALLFHKTEKLRVDCREAVSALITADQKASLRFDRDGAAALLASRGAAGAAISGQPTTLFAIYSYGDFRAATRAVRSDDKISTIEITRESCVPPNKVVAFFTNPFANLEAARTAPLKIENVLITPIPSVQTGWMIAVCILIFIAFFGVGPGVCVWLALSELMPTRIRSNGMSIALLINQAVSTSIAAIFLPAVGKYGYSAMFFAFAAFTVLYFITAFFFLPETKGRTLEEIEAHFVGKHR